MDLLQRYLTAKTAAGRSPRTLDWYGDQLGAFWRWCGERRIDPPGALAEEIDLFLAEQQAGPLKKSTVDARYRALTGFFNWCVARGHVAVSPMVHVERPEVPAGAREHVELEEFRRLLGSMAGGDWLDDRDRLAVSLLFWCGLRVSELVGLEVADLYWSSEQPFLTVRSAAKGGLGRAVPMPGELREDVLRYLYNRPVYPGPELLLAHDGFAGTRGALTDNGVRQMLRRRCKAAGLRYMHPHLFRHGFGMAFLNAGMEIKAVSQAMGHSSVQVTERFYARWLTGPLSREMQAARGRLLSR